MVKAPLKQSFHVRASGWIAGQRVEIGDVVELTIAEAKYEPVDPVAPEPGPAPKRRPSQEAASS